ncbi:MAG: BamA/TamA family outer membrane protein [Chitinophagaceae bacterium]
MFFLILLTLLTASCKITTIVKKYPPRKPFVFETKVNVEGKYTKDQKAELEARLLNQLDDSMRVREVSKVVWTELRRPPVFDTVSADKSILFMHSLMNKLGYFRDSIYYKVTIDTVNEKQLRAKTVFTVRPGKMIYIDSIAYNIKNPDLQRLTDSSMKEAYLKKGGTFSQDTVAAELDRLIELYRNRGYLRITRDELVCLWDTLDASLLTPALDPFEQLQQLQEIQQHRANPTVNLEIRLRPTVDSSRLKPYYVGNINMYPDLNEDTASYYRKEKMVKDIKMIYYRNLFKLKSLPENVYLKRGDLYSQRRYLRTTNRFNSLGAWRLVDIEQLPRKGTDSVDFNIKLSPAQKYLFTSGLEGSFNSGSVLSVTNLFGIGYNVGLQNRNFARASNQSTTNARFGLEFSATRGQQFIQTKQASLGHSIYFPRLIPKMKFIPERLRDNGRTVLSFNVANTDRKDLFNLTTINGAWGYDFAWRNRRQNVTQSLGIKLPNIEYNFLTKRDSLQNLIDSNPSLKYIFNQGLIVSTLGSYSWIKDRKHSTDIVRFNAEESGLLVGLIKTKAFDSLYRFIKFDADYGHRFKLSQKTDFVVRLFAGIGFELKSPSDDKSKYLPFFRQFYAGGPSSMRGWGLRRLGPGSTVKDYKSDPFRSGDLQLEANAEYRFYITTIADTKINSVLFTDVGNIWYRTSNPDYPAGTFHFNSFVKDLGVDVGTGIRADFNYFLVRLDYGLKARNPSPQVGDAAAQWKWFYNWDLKTVFGGQLQLGINYPFGY